MESHASMETSSSHTKTKKKKNLQEERWIENHSLPPNFYFVAFGSTRCDKAGPCTLHIIFIRFSLPVVNKLGGNGVHLRLGNQVPLLKVVKKKGFRFQYGWVLYVPDFVRRPFWCNGVQVSWQVRQITKYNS